MGTDKDAEPSQPTSLEVLKAFLTGRFAPLFKDGEPNVVEGGVCGALTALERAGMFSVGDEETVTASLLGALMPQ